MPISIDQTFEDASTSADGWRKAFICTEMLVEGNTDFVVCPPPNKKFIYDSYKYNLEILLKYPNNDPYYVMIVEALTKYIKDWEFHM